MTDITKHKWFDCAVKGVELIKSDYLVIRSLEEVSSTMLNKSDAIAIAKHFGVLDVEEVLIHQLEEMGKDD